MTPITETALYLTDYSDEVTPCDTTLAAWQDWLAQPDLAWGRTEAAAEGQIFSGWWQTITWHRAAAVDFAARTVTLDPPAPADIDLVAVSDGPGRGWDADSLCVSLEMLVADRMVEAGDAVAILGAHRPTRLQWRGGQLVEIGPEPDGGAA